MCFFCCICRCLTLSLSRLRSFASWSWESRTISHAPHCDRLHLRCLRLLLFDPQNTTVHLLYFSWCTSARVLSPGLLCHAFARFPRLLWFFAAVLCSGACGIELLYHDTHLDVTVCWLIGFSCCCGCRTRHSFFLLASLLRSIVCDRIVFFVNVKKKKYITKFKCTKKK